MTDTLTPRPAWADEPQPDTCAHCGHPMDEHRRDIDGVLKCQHYGPVGPIGGSSWFCPCKRGKRKMEAAHD